MTAIETARKAEIMKSESRISFYQSQRQILMADSESTDSELKMIDKMIIHHAEIIERG